MIDNLNDLKFNKEDTVAEIESKISEKLGVDILYMKESLNNYVQNNFEKLSQDFNSLSPYADYGQTMYDSEKIAEFLRQDASKVDNWQLYAVMPNDVNSNLLQFIFNNLAIDEGDSFQGHVFVSSNGKIKHAFAQVN